MTAEQPEPLIAIEGRTLIPSQSRTIRFALGVLSCELNEGRTSADIDLDSETEAYLALIHEIEAMFPEALG